MDFANPQALWLLLLLPVAVTLIAVAARARKARLGDWGDQTESLHRTSRRRTLRNLLWLVALLGFVVGVARPRGGAETRLMNREGSDIVFVLDLSKSMLTEDVVPNRLGRAVFEVERLLDRLVADRIGLVVFAGTAFIQSPLTIDSGLVRKMMHNLTPELMPYPGTNLAGGITKALSVLEGSGESGRAIVLLTDGEETTGDARRAAQSAVENRVPLYVLAFGTAEGQPIPVGREDGGLLRGPDGKPVISRLDEGGLRELARMTGGDYFRVGKDSATGVDDVLRGLEKRMLEARTITERAELYHLAVTPAVFFLLAGLWLTRRYTL